MVEALPPKCTAVFLRLLAAIKALHGSKRNASLSRQNEGIASLLFEYLSLRGDATALQEAGKATTAARRSRSFAPAAAAAAEIDAVPAPSRDEIALELARIVGGVETTRFDHCVLLGRNNSNGTRSWFCTGVLIHPRVVFSAAHCVKPWSLPYAVALGATKSNDLSTAEIINCRPFRHPDYDGFSGEDFALFILHQDAETDPCPLGTTAEIECATDVTPAGFGNSDIHSTRGFGVKREVIVPITGGAGVGPSSAFDPSFEFSAGGGGYDSCNGDSGGPAYIETSPGQFKVAGLTSRALGNPTTPCGEGGIYTRVDAPTVKRYYDEVLANNDINLDG